MTKTCIKCFKQINEENPCEKWAMMITKLGKRILRLECFHDLCWREFWDESVKIAVNRKI